MHYKSLRFFIAAGLMCTTAFCGDWKVYYGDLHTHCAVSDGKGTPKEAYEYAKGTAKVDFLALTDHNKKKLDQDAVDGVIAAANAEQTKTFAPLFGQEFSTNENGNHVNVFGVCEPIPETMNSDFRRLYRDWLPAYQARHPKDLVFCQFNHPRSKNKDYGISSVTVKKVKIQNYEDDWDAFAADAGQWVRLISLVNGPAEKTKTPPHGLHKDILPALVNTWFFYLDKGMRLAPTCNHDTHVESWGDLSDGRTGVWLDEPLSRDAMMKALDKGRCFATEDKNLSIWFELGGSPMGTQLPEMGATSLTVKVKVRDGDESGSMYTVEVFRDLVGDGDMAKVIAAGEVKEGGTYSAEFPHAKGDVELCLVHVRQKGADDDAWSAPVYIGPDSENDDKDNMDGQAFEHGVKFVSAKGSGVYHYTSCSIIQRIKPENIIPHKQVPSGLRLHRNCPQE